MNSSFNSIFSPSHYNPFYQQLQQESQLNHKQEFSIPNNKLNGQNFQSPPKMQQENEKSRLQYFPQADERYYYHANQQQQQQQQNQQYYVNNQRQFDQQSNDNQNSHQFSNSNEKNQNVKHLNTNVSTVNANNNSIQQQQQQIQQHNKFNYIQNSSNELFIPPPNYNQNPNFLSQYNGYSLNAMPLAFPPSFSHQLATLSLDQQKYLLEQQRALVLTLAVTEQMAQIQLNQQGSH